ncbi:Tad domain-containing protein [Sphingosinicella terrae]|uniref:Tad domain-containing protein n=1 Tax=Sphingosinicella terrae TaxID=2172047 RepID=UPI000E0D9355|nr:Tad domain-containing protein [Sphingosinicella terrae]
MSVFRVLRCVFQGAPARRAGAARRPFLTRLARNEAGNMMAIMAISLFPLAGLVGGALDMSRLYLVKTRLQQACDAGALAGRRIMAAGQWSANNNAANTAALQFFDGNFENESYGTSNRTRAFAEASGRVTGTASVQVPMTLMRIFGQSTRTISVSCDAEMRLPNTDVMFVLDTTGSMNDTIPGDSSRKMDTLQFAVKCFYETVAKYNIDDVDCTPGSPGPSGGTGNQVQIRFGFVPYATNVRVGHLLPPEYMADEWTYQSRVANYTTPVDVETVTSNTTQWEVYPESIDRDDCGRWGRNERFTNESTDNVFQPNPAQNPVVTGSNPYTRITYSNDNRENQDWSYWGAPDRDHTYRSCRRQVRTEQYTTERRYGFTNWTYRAEPMSVRDVVRGTAEYATGTSGTVPAPGTYDLRELATLPGARGIAKSNWTWDGCIEERATVREASYWPIPAGALDLDIDQVPSSGTAGSHWGPMLRRAVFQRENGSGNRTTSEVTTTQNFDNPSYSCPVAATKLGIWSDPAVFRNYVNSLNTSANTYHDIGMIWGARLMSPTGIFADENDFTPQGGEIERHMIFMTDGQTCTGNLNYVAYGLPWYDRRQTNTGSAPTDGCDDASSDGGQLSQQVNARFSAICNWVRNQNITLWVVYFGTTDQDTVDRMTACATPGRYFTAANSATLISTFRTIADQISQLRLTR